MVTGGELPSGLRTSATMRLASSIIAVGSSGSGSAAWSCGTSTVIACTFRVSQRFRETQKATCRCILCVFMTNAMVHAVGFSDVVCRDDAVTRCMLVERGRSTQSSEVTYLCTAAPVLLSSSTMEWIFLSVSIAPSTLPSQPLNHFLMDRSDTPAQRQKYHAHTYGLSYLLSTH